MLGLHTPLPLISCTLLLLASTSGHSRPDVDRTDSTVKKGLLGFLGMDREPRPARKASPQELRRIHQLYEETLSKMRGNSSQAARKPWKSMKSTVLFPVKQLKAVQRGSYGTGKRVRWYRAVFQKDPSLQTELSLIQAELKISGQFLHPLNTELRRHLKLKVNGMKPASSAGWTESEPQSNTSTSQYVSLDISPEVRGWMRTAEESLVVDVGVAANRDTLKLKPAITLELQLVQPYPAANTRLRRSNKEDNCDERGWCCRRSVTVSFKDIGWSDWVVAPAEYTMHFCDGTCPHNYKPASMHTQLKSRLHQITKGGTPRPCCVPAAYEPMVLMHYDSRGRLKLTPFSDFIVSKCHCA